MRYKQYDNHIRFEFFKCLFLTYLIVIVEVLDLIKLYKVKSSLLLVLIFLRFYYILLTKSPLKINTYMVQYLKKEKTLKKKSYKCIFRLFNLTIAEAVK